MISNGQIIPIEIIKEFREATVLWIVKEKMNKILQAKAIDDRHEKREEKACESMNEDE